jgi:filamentous hemagglutinin family protein
MAGGLNLGRAESRCLIAAVLSAFSFSAFDAQAQLTGGHVVGGQATISSPTATSTLIHQTSPTAIINWQSFSIPSGSSVTFQQPGASAIALNRVTGGSASLIYGSLTANGQVWLINSNGIALGPTAQVSAAGVLLSTMGIRDQDFLAGNYTFGIPGDPNASIVNQGRIVATDAGSVILAAPKVRNDGLIEADLGTVVLAGAKTVTVDFAGDDLLKFAVPVAAVDTVAPGTDALVSNTGTIAAPGGRVLLTAAAAKGVLDNVINTSGIVEATSVASVNGKIVLSATGGAAQVSGTLDASGKGAGETGGAIDVLGDAVTVAAGAKLDASGDAGGGTVLVGGNFHGAGPEQNAQTTIVEADSQIDVSAISQGNGGRVAVWSDGSTNFSGSILARGGAQGGDGGYVETSGAHVLGIGGSANVDTRAPRGKIGTWLLDPSDPFDIVADAQGPTDPGLTDPNGNGGFIGQTASCSGGALGCVLTVGTIQNGLSSNDVLVQSGASITVDAQITPPLGSNSSLALEADGGNITLNKNINFGSSGGNLYLQASGSIVNGGGVITSGAGGLAMSAGSGIGSGNPIAYSGGDIAALTNSGGIFVTSAGALNVTSLSPPLLDGGSVSGITATSGSIVISANGSLSFNSAASIFTGNGSVKLVASSFPSTGDLELLIAKDIARGDVEIDSTGSLTVQNPITYFSPHDLTLAASYTLSIQQPIDGINGDFLSGNINLQGGAISIEGPVSAGSSLVAVTGAGPLAVQTSLSAGADLQLSGHGDISIGSISSSASLSAGGNITVDAHIGKSLNIFDTTFAAGSGSGGSPVVSGMVALYGQPSFLIASGHTVTLMGPLPSPTNPNLPLSINKGGPDPVLIGLTGAANTGAVPSSFGTPPFSISSGPEAGPGATGGEGGGGGILTSVLDLDTGAQLFSEIAPNSLSGSGAPFDVGDPLTIIEPITPAAQAVPPTQYADEPVAGAGGLLYRTRGETLVLPGVPGIDVPWLGLGNRGLWFSAPP